MSRASTSSSLTLKAPFLPRRIGVYNAFRRSGGFAFSSGAHEEDKERKGEAERKVGRPPRELIRRDKHSQGGDATLLTRTARSRPTMVYADGEFPLVENHRLRGAALVTAVNAPVLARRVFI